MRRHYAFFATIVLAAVPAVVLAVTPAWAGRQRIPTSTPAFPIEHVVASAMADNGKTSPYAMNLTDQAAQSLGMAGGHWEAFDTGRSSSDPFVPALRGGVDGRGAMIRLQWQ